MGLGDEKTGTYEVGVDGANGCEGAAQITTEDECKTAATALGKNWGNAANYAHYEPKGCFLYGTSAYFNSGEKGRGKATRVPICSESTPEVGPPNEAFESLISKLTLLPPTPVEKFSWGSKD